MRKAHRRVLQKSVVFILFFLLVFYSLSIYTKQQNNLENILFFIKSIMKQEMKNIMNCYVARKHCLKAHLF